MVVEFLFRVDYVFNALFPNIFFVNITLGHLRLKLSSRWILCFISYEKLTPEKLDLIKTQKVSQLTFLDQIQSWQETLLMSSRRHRKSIRKFISSPWGFTVGCVDGENRAIVHTRRSLRQWLCHRRAYLKNLWELRYNNGLLCHTPRLTPSGSLTFKRRLTWETCCCGIMRWSASVTFNSTGVTGHMFILELWIYLMIW